MRTIKSIISLVVITATITLSVLTGQAKTITMPETKITGHVNTVDKQKLDAAKVVSQMLMHLTVSKLYADENILETIKLKVRTTPIIADSTK